MGRGVHKFLANIGTPPPFGVAGETQYVGSSSWLKMLVLDLVMLLQKHLSVDLFRKSFLHQKIYKINLAMNFTLRYHFITKLEKGNYFASVKGW